LVRYNAQLLYLRLSCHHEPALKGLLRNWKTKGRPQLSRYLTGLVRVAKNQQHLRGDDLDNSLERFDPSQVLTPSLDRSFSLTLSLFIDKKIGVKKLSTKGGMTHAAKSTI